jgi:cyclopropane-fatty-acyl-phospholipid synthase
MGNPIEWAERGWLPDFVIRWGIRQLLRRRLNSLPVDVEASAKLRASVLEEMRRAPVALSTREANEQHYELPAEVFTHCLGPHLKYSCCLFARDDTNLAAAEAAMLALTCERAGVANGQRILELGCGWGSLSLWMAERYPDSHIHAVSNSASQRRYIEAQRDQRGLRNLHIDTADMNSFVPAEGDFDRVVSVEMFEHMRNWDEMFARVYSWLRPGGRFFMHVFCHRHSSYVFESERTDDWMGRYFFRDGLMPAADLPWFLQRKLRVLQHWNVNGRHYERTCNAWLARQDEERDRLMPVFEQVYGAHAAVWFQRWRMFYMACAELFGFRNGNEWFVSHVLLERPQTSLDAATD